MRSQRSRHCRAHRPNRAERGFAVCSWTQSYLFRISGTRQECAQQWSHVQDLRPGTFSGLANLEYLYLNSNFIMVISALQLTSRSTRPFSVSSEICPHTWMLHNQRTTKR